MLRIRGLADGYNSSIVLAKILDPIFSGARKKLVSSVDTHALRYLYAFSSHEDFHFKFIYNSLNGEMIGLSVHHFDSTLKFEIDEFLTKFLCSDGMFFKDGNRPGAGGFFYHHLINNEVDVENKVGRLAELFKYLKSRKTKGSSAVKLKRR